MVCCQPHTRLQPTSRWILTMFREGSENTKTHKKNRVVRLDDVPRRSPLDWPPRSRGGTPVTDKVQGRLRQFSDGLLWKRWKPHYEARHVTTTTASVAEARAADTDTMPHSNRSCVKYQSKTQACQQPQRQGNDQKEQRDRTQHCLHCWNARLLQNYGYCMSPSLADCHPVTALLIFCLVLFRRRDLSISRKGVRT